MGSFEKVLGEHYQPIVDALGGKILYESEGFLLANHNERLYLLTTYENQLELHLGLKGNSDTRNLIEQYLGTMNEESTLEHKIQLFGTEYRFDHQHETLPRIAWAQEIYLQHELIAKISDDIDIVKSQSDPKYHGLIDDMALSYLKGPLVTSPYFLETSMELMLNKNFSLCDSSLYRRLPLDGTSAQNIGNSMKQFEATMSMLDTFFALTPMARMLNLGKDLTQLNIGVENEKAKIELELLAQKTSTLGSEPDKFCVVLDSITDDVVEYYTFPSELNTTISNRFIVAACSVDVLTKVKRIDPTTLSAQERADYTALYNKSPPIVHQWCYAENDIIAQMHEECLKTQEELNRNKDVLGKFLDDLLAKNTPNDPTALN